MLWLLIAVPAIAALLAFALPWNWPRRALLVASAGLHAGLSAAALASPPQPLLNGWIALDAASLLFLAITSTVFLVTSFYAVGYLAREGRRDPEPSEDIPFVNFPEAVFTGCLLLFLAAMTLVVVSHHWGLMWVAVEGTTLASAPLIYFHRYPKSLEATWKYLVICSVGIALALLGNFFLAVAAKGAHLPLHLAIADLERHAGALDPLWLQAAFLLLLVGYGTKMGLAPLHTWLPDAHSEAPSIVSALLSGVLLNCAFLAILRGHSLLVKAGLGKFSQDLLVLFGLVSMVVAAVFIIRQADYKRLLAYSSIEHMGILALGVGIGGVAGFGSMLHAVNHSFTKAMLFLAAGNTLAFFHTKSTAEARGTLRVLPVTGVLWIAGLLAITGSPPFGTFLSEFTVLKGIVDGGHVLTGVCYLAALGAVFVGMSAVVLPIVYGTPAAEQSAVTASQGPATEAWWSVAPPLVLGTGVLLLGLYLPAGLSDLLKQAAIAVGAQ
ncbi:MAG: NADH dehydrogenase FAD-containing subunit [Pirellulales bacterium]|nr:NADH dehydrogenase FAD-containing subunit [Pirellulales bacterium]